jgi:outer membrane PBP1 activator LpoA protein
MRIVNGRWQDTNGEPVTEQNYGKLKKIGDNLTSLYGKDITYSRIDLLTTITSLTTKQENSLVGVLNQEGLISKLAGY